eukprot:c3129_g1_i1 orf=125-379(-)
MTHSNTRKGDTSHKKYRVSHRMIHIGQLHHCTVHHHNQKYHLYSTLLPSHGKPPPPQPHITDLYLLHTPSFTRGHPYIHPFLSF